MNAKKTILVVEDEKDVQIYLKTLFEDNGYDTITAEDGLEGFDIAKAKKPDLITLDIAMPNQTGLRTYRQYKEDDELKGIPVVIITAVGDELRRFLQKLGGFTKPEGFMNKPIEKDVLLKMVADLL